MQSQVEQPEEKNDEGQPDDGALYAKLSTFFIFICLYIGAAASSATHLQLLLGGSLPLPLLDATIPIQAFFILVPAVVLMLHVHLLVHYHLLVRRLAPQTTNLIADRDHFLNPVPVLRNDLEGEDVWIYWVVRTGQYALIAALPVLVLFLIQYFFLPYHSVSITLWHQTLIAIDLGVLWYVLFLSPMYRKNKSEWKLEEKRWWWPLDARASVGLAIVGVLICCALFVVIVPGTWIELAWAEERICRPGLLTRNLDLAGEELIDKPLSPELYRGGEPRDVILLKHAQGVHLAGRNLRCANLEDAKLVNADLRGADLRGALLVEADLRGANLNPLDAVAIEQVMRTEGLTHTQLDRARLRRARFDKARLVLASFEAADLQGVDLSTSQLTGASFRLASLQGADLTGADLSRASLEGSDLSGAHLEGATLHRADLRGARLLGTDASLASFADANLEGVMAAHGVFRAADFQEANLTGSDFRRASLQGATGFRFEALDARGAHLGGICKVGAIKKLTDFRLVDFAALPSWEWQVLRKRISPKLQGLPVERIAAVLARIADAEKRPSTPESQALCMGTYLGLPTYLTQRQLLYLDDPRPDALAALPPVAQQAPAGHKGPWNEAAFHRNLAAELLSRACESPVLARTLLLRAAGEDVPGDPSLDLELARQILPWLQDEECDGVRKTARETGLSLGVDLAKQISWRLLQHQRAEEEER